MWTYRLCKVGGVDLLDMGPLSKVGSEDLLDIHRPGIKYIAQLIKIAQLKLQNEKD